MTGLEGRLVPTSVIEQDGQQANAVVEIVAEGKRYAYAAVCKRVDRFATLGIIKHQLALCDKPGLLVAPHITPEVAARCRELHIPFIDTAGNVSLCAPGVFVFVTGQRPRLGDMPRTDTTPRATTATGLRVVFALLCLQELFNAPYRDMGRAAGVALGTVSGVFQDLRERGYIMRGTRKGARRLLLAYSGRSRAPGRGATDSRVCRSCRHARTA